MTSGRPYRRDRQMTTGAAIAELERCRGTQFDPDVVQAFVRAVREGAIPLPEGA